MTRRKPPLSRSQVDDEGLLRDVRRGNTGWQRGRTVLFLASHARDAQELVEWLGMLSLDAADARRADVSKPVVTCDNGTRNGG